MKMEIPFGDIDKRKYVPIKYIGRGAYGVVWSYLNRETNTKVAIKKIGNVFRNSLDSIRTLREMKLLRHIKHTNVISLTDVMIPTRKRSFKDVYLVSELMDTDLDYIIEKTPHLLSKGHCQWFLAQLLQGLEYLHYANILHRDLKPANLFVNANGDLKIGDFGHARTNALNGEFMTEYVVTRWYRAPELLLLCESYGTSIDVWSVGCIFAELLGGKPIFPGNNTSDQLELIMSVLGSPDDSDLEFIDNLIVRQFVKLHTYTKGTPFSELFPHAGPLAIDLLQKLLAFNPAKRIGVSEALNHPYFDDMCNQMCNPPSFAPVEIGVVETASEEVIREMIWNEMLHYHPCICIR